MSATNGKALTAATGRALSEASQSINKGTIVSNSIALTIGAAIVRQVDGLYSLNDLHKASGGESGARPGEFMRISYTQNTYDTFGVALYLPGMNAEVSREF